MEQPKATTKPTTKARNSQNDLAESWEDAAEETVESDTAEESLEQRHAGSTSNVSAPSRTPAFSSAGAKGGYTVFPSDEGFAGPTDRPTNARARADGERRPDKTTSVASRLIAAGIGQKAPRRTEEQRRYDQAMKIQEKRKRDLAREEEERKQREKVQAQKDIWGD